MIRPYRNETELSAAATKLVESAGFPVLRLQAGRVRARNGWVHGNKAGCPDKLAVLSRGRIAWLEAKFEGGERSPEQERWHADARRRGHIVITFWTPAEALRGVLAAEKAP